MNVATVRIGKELRALLVLWGALTVVGAMLLLPAGFGRFSYSAFLTAALWRLAGFWIGLPLLATLSMGHEFQHRTASLLFSQPIHRTRIWREKWIVLAPAMATASVLYLWTDVGLGLGLPAGYSRLDVWQPRTIAIVWLVTATCTAPFWTLVGRSTLNGLILNLIQGFAMFQIWQWADSVFVPGYVSHRNVLSAGVIAATAYSLLMLSLGRRKFLRFEVERGSAGADLLAPGSRGTSHSAGMLRSRPGQPILNLVRKEMRLLWLVWGLAIVNVLGVLCLAALQFAPGYSMEKVGFLVSSFVLALSSMSAILAGSLSMGEERTSGTQSWHRTLPISGLVQWFVKLGVVLSVSFVAAVLPVTVAKFAVGEDLAVPFGFGYPGHVVLSLFVFSSLLSFAAFWCASLVKGTIRAALLSIAAIVLVAFALNLGRALVGALHFQDTLDPLVLKFHPFPFAGETTYLRHGMNLLIVPPLLVAVIQSYHLFRREASERFFAALRPLLEVALAALVLGLVLGIPSAFVTRAYQLSFRAFQEADDAIYRMDQTSLETIEILTRSRQLSLEDLSKAGSLSDDSRLVLRDATISADGRGVRGRYVTAIRFKNGLNCIMGFYVYKCEMASEK